MEILYVVELSLNGLPVVLGKLRKSDEAAYQYVPYHASRYSKFKWTNEPFKSKQLPEFVKQRIFSEYNLGVDKFLKQVGLLKYDEWELLKRTRGASRRDKLMFLTPGTLKEKLDFDAGAYLRQSKKLREMDRLPIEPVNRKYSSVIISESKILFNIQNEGIEVLEWNKITPDPATQQKVRKLRKSLPKTWKRRTSPMLQTEKTAGDEEAAASADRSSHAKPKYIHEMQL